MTLSESQIAALLEPYLTGADVPPGLYAQLGVYLDLLLRWNARTNLTAIRDPDEIIRRHFGESLFTAVHLKPLLPPAAALLDFGSGAGFPGLPIQLALPTLRITLAESQGKKASFLREVVRTLGLQMEVWAARAETMRAERRFDVVTLRAVDNMDSALTSARLKVSPDGILAALGGPALSQTLAGAYRLPVPGANESFLYLLRL